MLVERGLGRAIVKTRLKNDYLSWSKAQIQRCQNRSFRACAAGMMKPTSSSGDDMARIGE